MGGDSGDKLKQAQLQAINNQNMAASQAAVAANKPSPIEEALTKRFLDWTSATDGKTPLDVGKLPGMSPYMSLYKRAAAGQQGERMGLGSLRMGAENADPNLATNRAAQDKMRREQEAGGELESAYGQTNAEITGTGMPLVGADISRKGTNVGATTNMADSSLGAWSRFQVRPSFWSQLALAGVKGASDVASAYYTG